MRRVVGAILLTFGVFALSMGLLLRTVVYDRLAVAPLEPAIETVAQGTGMTVFYPQSLSDSRIPPQRTDATVTARRLVSGQLDAPEVKVDGDVAQWRVGLVVEDEKSTLINAVEQWVCVNRRTGESVRPCRDQKIDNGSTMVTDVDMSGINYKFPFDTARRDYKFFDITLQRSTPIRFSGAEKVNGLDTYRFVQTIDPVEILKQQVPGQLVNATPGTSVSASRMYQNVRTVWVEPNTGIIVKGQEQVRQAFRGPDGREGTVLLAGTLAFTPQTVERQVDAARKSAGQLRLLKSTGPLIAGLLGVLLIAAGLFLMLARGRASFMRHGRGRTPANVREPERVS